MSVSGGGGGGGGRGWQRLDESGRGGFGAPTDPQYGGYGRQNPYEPVSSSGGYSNNTGYDNSYSGGGGAVDYSDGGAVEMNDLAASDPNAVLNACRALDADIADVERNLDHLRSLQQRSLDDADTSPASATNSQLEQLSSETMSLYRDITQRIRTIKSRPDAGQPRNAPHIERVDRRLKAAIQQYQQVEAAFRKRTQEQMARQYRIVRPDAPEEEVRAAVEDPSGGQVFSQALMQSSRQMQATAALSAVQDRQVQLQKIEQQMTELAQLFQDLDTLLVQQDVNIVQMNQKSEQIVENLDKGNEEIAVAVKTARATRRKKWWCLGICIAIILVVVIIVLIYLGVTGQLGGKSDDNNNSKRAIEQAIDFGLAKTVPQAQSEESLWTKSRIMGRRAIME